MSPTLSMTGFGRAVGEVSGTQVAVEISSLNHKSLELHLHLPGRWGRFEPRLRACLKKGLARGKVRMQVRVDSSQDRQGTPWVFAPEVAELYRQSLTALGGSRELSPQELVLAPGVVQPLESRDGFASDQEGEELFALVEAALAGLCESRRGEGEVLCQDLRARIAKIRTHAQAVEARLPQVREALIERFRERVGKLLKDVELAEDRLLTEAALYVDRMDVAEELVRLEAHLDRFLETLDKGGVCGRRLSFLGQEMNRESNTLGAKSLDPACSAETLEIKELVANIREQVENLE